jgi:hypothetical protein
MDGGNGTGTKALAPAGSKGRGKRATAGGSADEAITATATAAPHDQAALTLEAPRERVGTAPPVQVKSEDPRTVVAHAEPGVAPRVDPPTAAETAAIPSPAASNGDDPVAMGAAQEAMRASQGTAPVGRPKRRMTFYTAGMAPADVRVAPVQRQWMDESRERFAYRCLPLLIGNSYGWQFLNPVGFNALWDGSPGAEGIKLIADPGGRVPIARGHFGGPIMTFSLPGFMRTEEGYDLMVTGPINFAKDGISALTAVVETDWLPFSFTMNYQFTRPGASVRFERGEPFCQVFPIKRAEIEDFDPVIRPHTDCPELHEQYEEWGASRTVFNRDAQIIGSPAHREKWQKFYQKGTNAAKEDISVDHRTRLSLRPFRPPNPGEIPE